jgi:hypothetical protein
MAVLLATSALAALPMPMGQLHSATGGPPVDTSTLCTAYMPQDDDDDMAETAHAKRRGEVMQRKQQVGDGVLSFTLRDVVCSQRQQEEEVGGGTTCTGRSEEMSCTSTRSLASKLTR